jgi:polyhydroxyalkanoate synthesis regulator phasin
MSGVKYIRDSATGAVLLADPQTIDAFRQKKTLAEDVEALKAEINTLKQQVQQLISVSNHTQQSE